ncbi:MAG: mitofilin family membrane protein [Phreatobacter sp.]|uniref:COG4223 family protein n=1 Tax=Phreatobacter sp. TaxID=1966341 RepID=UPI0027344C70|nr:mitofilin family membrane protein [Phreatobacter sp.]MDP2801459.1 mitofilin family membrane protein [Phreatobacter sp.]
MASNDRPSDDPKLKRRGKAPTITLEAQEVVPAADTAASDTAGIAANGGPESAPAPEPATETVAAATDGSPDVGIGLGDRHSSDAPSAIDAAAAPATSSMKADAPTPDAVPVEAPGSRVGEGSDQDPVTSAARETPPDTPPPTPSRDVPPPPATSEAATPSGTGFGRLVAAGLVGALLTGGLAAGAQMAGYWPTAALQDNGALEQRLAALDSQVRQMASRPAATGAPAVDLAPVTRRIEALDAARSGLETRLAALEQRPAPAAGGSAAAATPVPAVDLAPLRTEIDALKTAVEAVATAQRATPPAPPPAPPAPSIDMASVEARVAALTAPQSGRIAEIGSTLQLLEAEMKATAATGATLTEKVTALEAARAQAGDSSRRAALVIGLGALRAAVDRGQPFAEELRMASALGLPAEAASALQSHAERGLPATGALAQRFAALAPALLRAAPGPAADGTMLERLTASAQNLVRIRPVGEAAGDDVPTAIARIEAKLRRADLAGALADFDRLPEPVRALGADWAAEARARAAAESALRRLSTDAASALSGG